VKCHLKTEQFTSRQNPKEFFFYISTPLSLDAVRAVHGKVDPKKVRGVVIGRSDRVYGKTQDRFYRKLTSFKTTGDGIVFDVPLASEDPPLTRINAVDVTQGYTYIETPGVSMRIERAAAGRPLSGKPH
jgi:hypothetical protein